MARRKSTRGSYGRAEDALRDGLPQLAAWLSGPRRADFVRLVLRQRGEHDWVSVLSAYDDAGAPVVCFGSGFDAVAALLGLEGAVAAGNWRPDRPIEQK
jgi:hypothetical protein